ncbi:MAG: ABC transporter permease [Chloroflexi bacterium]|nr:ABC transporter permease [Chloroflexota bacterium]MBU1751963.1 ABC transporter permease [Chloroflexota bacterium]
MLRRILNLVQKEFIQLARDRFLAPFIILGPLTELTLIAWATSTPIEYLPTAIVDLDRSPASRALVVTLQNSKTFDPTVYLDDTDRIAGLIDQGTVTAVVVIPPDFESDLRAGRQPEVQVIADGSDHTAAAVVSASAEGAVASFGWSYVRQLAAAQNLPPPEIDPRVRVWFNEDLRAANFEVPSELGLMLAAVTQMIACLGIVRERELGTLEQLLVTPTRPLELVVGKASTALVIAFVFFLLALSISIFLFGVPMRGSWLALAAIALLMILAELAVGLMISTISGTQQQALLLVFVVIFVEVVFAGYAFPVSTMPEPLQFIANFVPMKHFLIVMRGIMLKGSSLTYFGYEIGMMAVLALAANAVTLMVFRRRLD